MKHYFTKDGKNLIPVDDFAITLGAVDPHTGRKRPDIFTLKTTRALDTAGGFIVMREDTMMYDCEANSTSAAGSPPIVTFVGLIEKSLMAPDRAKALAAIAAAEGKGKDPK